MLTISDHHIHITHCMWQPTFQCVLQGSKACEGCYIKAAPLSFTQGPLNTQIIDLIYGDQPQVSCDQFTISLDTLTEKHDDLVVVLQHIWQAYLNLDKPDTLPKLCVTVRNHETLVKWATWMNINVEQFLHPLHMLSLSVFPNNEQRCQRLRAACDYTNTLLNYNRIALSTPDCPPQEFINGCQYANSVHIVLQKRPLGDAQDPMAFDQFTATCDSARSRAVRVYEDACVSDSKRYLHCGRTCSAAIDKVHVWPDGGVTGCPYDSHHRATLFPSGTSTLQQLRETVLNQFRHPMRLCKIYEVVR